MATNMKLGNGTMMVTFAEKKGAGASVSNYQMYTEGIKALCEIGRVATLKVVEAVTRVNNQSLWKLGNSEKTGLPYNSINEWAIGEFGYSKSHVSEMLSVAKQCCDPETGIPIETLAGYSYTQLLAFTKNPALLLKVKAGEVIEGIDLGSTAKEIKDFGKKGIEDKSKKEGEQSTDQTEQEPEHGENTTSNTTKPAHTERTITIKMEDLERWYGMIMESADEGTFGDCVVQIITEWDNLLGNPFTEKGRKI